MKKVFIFALCFLGMCSARAEMMTTQEIILTEMATTMQPWDSKDEGTMIRPTIPTEFHASILGNQLFISADVPAYVEVINPRTGRVIAEGEVIGTLVIPINQKGTYILQVYSGNSVFTGEFKIQTI